MSSSFNAPAWDVARPTGQCAATGRVLEPGETYVATLIDAEDRLDRVDICLEAWEKGNRPENIFCNWRTVVPEPQEKKKPFVDDEVLLNLLERLAEAEQPQRIAFRFVLMLLLMRKKLLRYDRTEKRGDGDTLEEWWILTPKLDPAKGPLGKWSPDRTLEVLDPHLDESGIRDVTDQLSQILQAEL